MNGVQRRKYHVAGAVLAQSTTDGNRGVERKYDDYLGTWKSFLRGQTTRQSSDWLNSKKQYITVGKGAENRKEKSLYVLGGKSKGWIQKLN